MGIGSRPRPHHIEKNGYLIEIKKYPFKDPNAFYCGRGTPVGNPFIMQRESFRDEVCNKYEIWFTGKMSTDSPEGLRVQEYMKVMQNHLLEHKVIYLVCHCAPKRCHAETLAKWLARCIQVSYRERWPKNV